MRHVIPFLMLAAAPLAGAAQAQDLSGYVLSADVGLGASYSPSYMGSDDHDASPWLILRNGTLSRPTASGDRTTDGFSIVPSFNFRGGRDSDDHDSLTGMKDIDRSGEVGFRLGYDYGATRSYLALRRGFGGHEGVVGEFGAKYRVEANDRLTLWGKAEAKYGSSDFTETYFGVTDAEATPDRAAYAPDGGVYAASLGLEARYALTEQMAVVGEVEYSRLIGDAADSPLVESKGQPSIRLGVVHRFSFGF
ncbi:MipA/OmpV family protein [Paracoccus sp. (in: a-proteobacteria)]|uniref:MipA/OmpV family protein n=1 Tax=Paracoccus sp. TaxID=267 RepID=UPI00289D100B|nr:MipA/OmpV family protein [Paracoccus sp. (in: a-proteobacteria)]